MHQEWFKLPKPLPALLVKCHERCPRVDNSVCSVQSRPPSPSLHRSLFFFTYIAEHKQLTSINVFQVSCSYYVGGCKLQLLVSKGQTIWTLACSALSVTTSAKQKGNSLCISHPFNFPNYLTTGNFHDLKKKHFLAEHKYPNMHKCHKIIVLIKIIFSSTLNVMIQYIYVYQTGCIL